MTQFSVREHPGTIIQKTGRSLGIVPQTIPTSKWVTFFTTLVILTAHRQKSTLTSAKEFCKGTLQCFTNFGYRQKLFTRGVYHNFLSKGFCLTVPKKIRKGTLPVFKYFRVSKVFMQKKVGVRVVSRFPTKNFCLIVTKDFVGELFCVSLLSDIVDFCAQER